MNGAMTTTSGSANILSLNNRRAERDARTTGSSNREVNKLLTAAVVSKAFCQLLLNNPAQALEDGYNGMRFALTSQEKELLLSIQAKSLSELASQINSRNVNLGQATPMVSPLMQV